MNAKQITEIGVVAIPLVCIILTLVFNVNQIRKDLGYKQTFKQYFTSLFKKKGIEA